MVPVLLGGPEEETGGRQLLDLDCFLSDISDTLFTMTQPSPSPLQLPPEDGEGLRPGRRQGRAAGWPEEGVQALSACVQAGGRGGWQDGQGKGCRRSCPSAAPDVSLPLQPTSAMLT